jgi:hypothetical protein
MVMAMIDYPGIAVGRFRFAACGVSLFIIYFPTLTQA